MAALLLALEIVGCQEKASTPAECSAGSSEACTGPGGCDGQRACAATTRQWGSCTCLPVQGDPPRIGRECTADSECANEEVCLDGSDAKFLGGVPVSGTCVVPCSGNPSRCENPSRPGVCVVTDDKHTGTTSDDEAYCFERCDFDGFSAGKCHDREHVACNLLLASETDAPIARPVLVTEDAGGAQPVAFCRPVCAADSQCPDGLACNLATGACEVQPRGGDPLGTPCDPEETPTSCAGTCLSVDGLSMCSHRCKFGEADNCGAPVSSSTPDSGATANPGLCRFPEDNGDVADTGFCTELCNCDDDCLHEDAVCDAFADRELEALTERKGVCVGTRDGSGTMRAGLPCD